MKKNLTTVLIITFIGALTSCSSTDSLVKTDRNIEFNRIGEENLANLAYTVSEIYENQQLSSRAANSIDAAKEIAETEQMISMQCVPLVEEGKNIRNQLIEIYEDEPTSVELTHSEFEAILNMTDDQLAACMLQLNALTDYEEFMIQTDQRQISSNIYVDCFMSATGMTDVVHIIYGTAKFVVGGSVEYALIKQGTKMIINAKTIGKLLGGMAVKYLGWGGVAVILYDYISCVNSSK